MRILRIANVPYNRTGGMSRAMLCTGDLLEQRGHHIEYLFSEQLGHASTRFTTRFVVPFRIPTLIRKHTQGRSPFDLVEIHEPLALGYARLRRPGIDPAFAVFSHGLEVRHHREKIAYFQKIHQPVTFKQRMAPWSLIAQVQFALRSVDVAICLNSQDHAELRRMLPEQKVVQVRNGVSELFLNQAPNEAMRSQQHILFLGTWIPRKGVLDLISALGSVLAEYPECRFTAAGTGVSESEVRQSFPQPFQSQIRVVPKIETDAELVQIYREHSIFVLPSFFEGLPLSLLEAAAMKMMLIATNCCGMRDVITSGKNGLLVPVGSADSLKQALRQSISDPAFAARMGTAAHESMLNYRWVDAANDLEAAYLQAIENQHHRRHESG